MSKLFNTFFHQKQGHVKAQRETIMKILEKGPSNVSKISDETGMAKDLIVWNLMGMLKWGEVEVVAEEEGELTYSVKEA